MTAWILALTTAAAWAYLATARGGFWRCREDDGPMHRALGSVPPGFAWPRVTAVVPARDEAELIGMSVGALLGQRYAGEFTVVVVDDHSQDGTAAIAARTAAELGQAHRLTVLPAPPLPAGWTGKLWALANGVAYASRGAGAPEYLWLVDADIHVDANSLSALVWMAIEERRVLSSLMVRLHCESLAERALIPAFVFFFQMIYPFAWVNQSNRGTAAAAGGCLLVQRQALARAGGLEAIRGEIIDDCALGRALKRVGPIRLALGERVQSRRASASFTAIRQMVVRSAYAQLGFSPARLAFVVAAMAIVFVAPVALAVLADGWVRGLGLLAWGAMALLFVPIAGRYRVSRCWGVALPAIAATYLACTLESAVQHGLGRGGRWKGRVHARSEPPFRATPP